MHLKATHRVSGKRASRVEQHAQPLLGLVELPRKPVVASGGQLTDITIETPMDQRWAAAYGWMSA